MTPAPSPALSVCAASGTGADPVRALTRRLAAAGFGVHATSWRDRHELAIVNLTAARAGFTLTGDGRTRWGYEPDAGHETGAAMLTAIIVHILGAPHTASTTPGIAAYRALGQRLPNYRHCRRTAFPPGPQARRGKRLCHAAQAGPGHQAGNAPAARV